MATTRDVAAALREVWTEGKPILEGGEIDWHVFAVELQRKTEPTDEEIEEAIGRVTWEPHEGPDREEIVWAVQHLLWPVDTQDFLHRAEITVWLKEDADNHGEWAGSMKCGGCQRLWTVEKGPTEKDVRQALDSAHAFYRTGVEPSLDFFSLLTRNYKTVEVSDRRLLT